MSIDYYISTSICVNNSLLDKRGPASYFESTPQMPRILGSAFLILRRPSILKKLPRQNLFHPRSIQIHKAHLYRGDKMMYNFRFCLEFSEFFGKTL